MNEFAQLIADMETLQKASPGGGAADPDDKKNAGDGSGGDEGAGDDKKIAAAADDGKDKSDAEKETFGKAIEVTLADGSKAEAFDGTAMLKALHTEHEELRAGVDAGHGEILKAFGMAVDSIRTLQTKVGDQETIIKALQTKVDTLGNAGVGRRTLLTIAEKLSPSAGVGGGAAAAAAGPTPNEVMAKAQFMVREGKLDAGQLPRLEAHQLRGMIAPPDLVARVPEIMIPLR